MHLGGDLLRLVELDGLHRLLDQADHVAHAEDAAGDTVGVKLLERVELLAGADQLDRLAGDGAHRQRRAAAPVAVDPCQHDAGERHARIEALGEIDRVLAGQRVGHQQRLVRGGDLLDRRGLGHQLFVDMRAAGGVEQQHVIAAELGGFQRAGSDLRGTLAGDDGERRHAGLLAQHAELLLRRGTPRIERGHQHFLLVALLQALAELGGRGGLAGALQADQHHRHGRRGGEVDALRIRPEHPHQLVIDDLDDHLAGRDRAHHLLADRLRLHAVDEVAHDIERDIGLEQRAAHLAHGLGDVGLAQRALAGELVEDGVEPVG